MRNPKSWLRWSARAQLRNQRHAQYGLVKAPMDRWHPDRWLVPLTTTPSRRQLNRIARHTFAGTRPMPDARCADSSVASRIVALSGAIHERDRAFVNWHTLGAVPAKVGYRH